MTLINVKECAQVLVNGFNTGLNLPRKKMWLGKLMALDMTQMVDWAIQSQHKRTKMVLVAFSLGAQHLDLENRANTDQPGVSLMSV